MRAFVLAATALLSLHERVVPVASDGAMNVEA
jgi:hypothetical protein